MISESLYYQCYYAFLLGDLTKASIYLDLIREEFKGVNPSDNPMKRHQLLTLARVRDAVHTGEIPKHAWVGTDTPVLPLEGAPTKHRQPDLVRAIHHKGLKTLKEALGEPSLYLYNLEHPCPPYGAVDMVYKGLETIYPLEVKKDCGDHDLIGQIGKYDLYHRLHLHLKHYEFVRPVTICRTYNEYTLRELKAQGVTTMIYSGTLESLVLSVV